MRTCCLHYECGAWRLHPELPLLPGPRWGPLPSFGVKAALRMACYPFLFASKTGGPGCCWASLPGLWGDRWMNWGDSQLCFGIPATPASSTPSNHYFAENREARRQTAWPLSGPEVTPCPGGSPPWARPTLPVEAWLEAGDGRSFRPSLRSVPRHLPRGAQRLWPAGVGRVRGLLPSRTLPRYEAARGGGEASAAPGARRGSGAAWSPWGPHHLHCLSLHPPPVRSAPGTGPAHLLIDRPPVD